MFHCVVLVPEGAEDALVRAYELIKPYDAGLSIELYEDACFCVGLEAEQEGDGLALEALRMRDPERDADVERISHTKPDDITDEENRQVEAYLAERRALGEYYEAQHPLHGRPSPDCQNCGGTGVETGMQNPIAEWAEWEIGKRFDGKTCLPVDEVLRRYDRYHHGQVERDCIRAVVTPDGTWHGLGRVDRIDGESDESRDQRYDLLRKYWDVKLVAILRANRACTAVSVEYWG